MTRKHRSGLTRAGTKRGAGGERARAHAKVRREGRRNVAEEIAAGRTELAADNVRADPMTARLTIGINALHGVAGHVLHAILLGASTPCAGERRPAKLPLLAQPGA